jgi:hypothetical protein
MHFGWRNGYRNAFYAGMAMLSHGQELLFEAADVAGYGCDSVVPCMTRATEELIEESLKCSV